MPFEDATEGDTVIAGVTGLLVGAGGLAALGRATRRLLGDRTARAAFSVAALDRVEQRHTPHPRTGRAVERRPADHPALGAAHPRHANLALRRAGLHQAPVDLRDQPGRVAAGAAAYARRMDFRDLDGAPLIKWQDAEGAFKAWQECSRGRLCDYTGLSYDKLRGGSGIPWPCNEEDPEGCDRLYADGVFPTHRDVCEDYGHDLLTGGTTSPGQYQARRPDGRAFLRAAEYAPSPEQPSDEYPFLVTTGRTAYHFHTRTKTGRSRQLRRAAPEPWVELSAADAAAWA